MSRFSSVQIRLLVTAALLLVVALVVVVALRQPASSTQSGAPTQFMALDSQVIANLTSLPKATPLAGQAANDIAGLQAMVQACTEYTPERRSQMIDQIGFIIDPAKIPSNVIIALGADPHARLLYAIGTVTANQWKLNNKPADSCLIPIGKRINQLLVAAAATPVAAFEGG